MINALRSIDAGSAAYWRDRKFAFALIRRAEKAAARAARAPMYLHGGLDEDGDVIAVENLAPLEELDECLSAIEQNQTAASILAAQGRVLHGFYGAFEVQAG